MRALLEEVWNQKISYLVVSPPAFYKHPSATGTSLPDCSFRLAILPGHGTSDRFDSPRSFGAFTYTTRLRSPWSLEIFMIIFHRIKKPFEESLNIAEWPIGVAVGESAQIHGPTKTCQGLLCFCKECCCRALFCYNALDGFNDPTLERGEHSYCRSGNTIFSRNSQPGCWDTQILCRSQFVNAYPRQILIYVCSNKSMDRVT